MKYCNFCTKKCNNHLCFLEPNPNRVNSNQWKEYADSAFKVHNTALEELMEYEQKDLEKEKAKRYNQGKPEISQVPNSLIIETAKVLGFGAQKYGRDNWRKGMSFLSVYDSLQRHLLAWKEGEDLDPESGESHLGHAACNLAFLIEFLKTRPEFDDRSKK